MKESIILYTDLLPYCLPPGDDFKACFGSPKSRKLQSIASLLGIAGWAFELFRYCAARYLLSSTNCIETSLQDFITYHNDIPPKSLDIWNIYSELGLIKTRWCWLDEADSVPLMNKRIFWSKAVWNSLFGIIPEALDVRSKITKSEFNPKWIRQDLYQALDNKFSEERFKIILTGPTGIGKTTLLRGIAKQHHRTIYTTHALDYPTLIEHAKYVFLNYGILHFDHATICNPETTAFRQIWPLLCCDICVESENVVNAWFTLPNKPTLINIPTLKTETRLEIIRQTSPEIPYEVAQKLATRHVLSIGQIQDIIKPVEENSTNYNKLCAKLKTQAAENLAGLATFETSKQQWEDLILPEELAKTVEDICTRYENIDEVTRQFPEYKFQLQRRCVALFSGDPGTGKTMTARLIAQRLNLPCLRVDLSQLVSKYIGETEKHLARIFDEALKTDVLLLFDEADSLFSKRTNVKSSNDRYANLEISYLLQRIEQFEGIAILTTNLAQSIDEAFERRIDFHLRFDLPDSDIRKKLWKHYLPEKALERIDLDCLADELKMGGAMIKRTVEQAMFNSVKTGHPLNTEQIFQIATRELASNGALISQLPRRSSRI